MTSDVEDSSPDVGALQVQRGKVSPEKLYMTQGKGFDTSSTGRNLQIDTAPLRTPNTKSPMKQAKASIHMEKSPMMMHPTHKKANTLMAGIEEDDQEGVLSPSMIRRGKHAEEDAQVAREAALRHENSAEAVRESKLRRSHAKRTSPMSTTVMPS